MKYLQSSRYWSPCSPPACWPTPPSGPPTPWSGPASPGSYHSCLSPPPPRNRGNKITFVLFWKISFSSSGDHVRMWTAERAVSIAQIPAILIPFLHTTPATGKTTFHPHLSHSYPVQMLCSAPWQCFTPTGALRPSWSTTSGQACSTAARSYPTFVSRK